MHAPKTAYVLLWFPLSSETFIFREVRQLSDMGLPIHVYTVYGTALKGCSQEMRQYAEPVTRLGSTKALCMLRAFWRELRQRPALVWRLMREGLFRHMRCWETVAENTCCFFAAFLLAQRFREDGVELIHSPWANGPGTAAWIASRLTGLPFVLTGRAGDIYPPDGVLAEKLRDAVLVRTNNAANVQYLAGHCPPDAGQSAQRAHFGSPGASVDDHSAADRPCKVRLVYNSLTFGQRSESSVPMQPPYRVLAVGRLVRTKGFDVLLEALGQLWQENFPCRLTLVGDGVKRRKLQGLIERFHLHDVVDMPGFVPHDQLLHYMGHHDMLVVPSVVDSSGDRDGIPNVIMEALSNGLPVIATDVSGISEVVHDGETGLLVAQRDPQALATAIRHLATHRDEALRMAATGKALVERMFDAQTNIRQLYELYGEAYALGRDAAGEHR